jgi:Zn-dependent M16 (insulinase) family peptidase
MKTMCSTVHAGSLCYLLILQKWFICFVAVVIPYEEVIKQLSADTLVSSASLGAVGGRRFRCGDFASVAALTVKVEREKYVNGVHWLRDLLYGVQFTSDRVHIIANKMINDVATLRRDGETVAQTVLKAMNFNKGSYK